MKRFLTLFLLILLVGCGPAAPDNQPVPFTEDGTVSAIRLDMMPGESNSQRLEHAIEMARQAAPTASGRNFYVTASPGRYVFKKPVNFKNVSWESPGGRRSVVFVFQGVEDGTTLVTFAGGHGQTVNGLWVTDAPTGGEFPKDLTAFKFSHVSSLHATNLDARLRGDNGTGYLITDEADWRNTESCRFESISAHCSNPMKFFSGDNCQFLNIDFTATPKPTKGVWAGIQGGPSTVLSSIRFGGSIQKGNHAVYFNSEFESGSKGVGDVGIFDGIRWEQGVLDEDNPAAWYLRFRRMKGDRVVHGQERILMIGCRHGHRAVDVHTEGVLGFETVGCYLPGQPVPSDP